MLLEAVADGEVTEVGRVAVPADRVASGPVAVCHCSDVQGHRDAVTGVEARAAHLREIPSGAEVAGTPLRVRLEAARSDDHGVGADLARVAAGPDPHAPNAVVVRQQRKSAAAVANVDPFALDRCRQRIDETLPATLHLQRQPTPEGELAVDVESLPVVARLEAHPLGGHPAHRRIAAPHQHFGEVGIGPVFGDACHIGQELLFGIAAVVVRRGLRVGHVGHEGTKVIDTVEGKADDARGEGAVTSAFVAGRPLEHGHIGALFTSSQRSAQCCVAAADHNDMTHQAQRTLPARSGSVAAW